MSQSPEEIREDIERTRAELGSDVDALAEKVSPSGIVHRQGQKVRDRMNQVKTSVMGAADNTTGSAKSGMHQAGESVSNTAHHVSDTAHHAGERVQNAPHQVAEKTRGNPMAAGLIAFGAGMLISSLIPASQKEQQAASALKEKAEPLKTELTDAAKQVAQDMKGPAQEALDSVKSSAQDAAGRVKEESAGAAADVKERAQDAKSNVQDTQSGSPTTADAGRPTGF
jgi:gas vesicle protein